MDVLRFTTAGSVDDGKSTLIGRLLVDTNALPDDQRAAIARVSDSALDLALVTDGLRAEREQGITIDVAYRYFATAKRKFIIADTPGHEQYTRNMVTGASNAHLAVVLIDATAGVVRQSRRHGFIASLLRIPHLLVAVNKMDLVGYSEDVFNAIVADYARFASQLEVPDVAYVPIAALPGDNVVERSRHMPWYDGPTLLHHLEHVSPAQESNVVDFRLPVQCVVRGADAGRGLAGQIASGSIRRGEPVVVLPSGLSTRLRSIGGVDAEIEQAGPGAPVIVTLEDDVEAGRGAMLVRPGNRPVVATKLDADLCWMSETRMRERATYLLQHTTRLVTAEVSRVVYRLNVDTLHREGCDGMELNDIGRVELTMAEPVFCDPYRINRRTGSFILIDPATHATVAAGMIRVGSAARPRTGTPADGALDRPIAREDFERRNGHLAAVVWFTGLSGAGKSTIAEALERRLFARMAQTARIDGDDLRTRLSRDLGFSPADRTENIRRAGETARMFFERGCLTICTFVSPYRDDRSAARGLVPEGRFFEVYVDCDVETCAARDPKGLYRRALAGELPQFTGVSAPYEPPEHPELVLRTAERSVDECVEDAIGLLERAGILPPA